MANLEQAVIGGGCFWCTEAIYSRIKGVKKVEPGYAGGSVPHPSYKLVCTGTTGHAEVVRISYDADVITYKEIIDIFWYAHDPTTLNRQGNDIGTQYRSIIFFENDARRVIAERSLQEARESGDFKNAIVTQIEELNEFYLAEEYHFDYFANNPNQPYCAAVIAPKVKHFFEKFPEN